MVEAVLFDLDDTLLVDEEDVDAAFRRVTVETDRIAGVAPGTVAHAVREEARRIWRASPHFDMALALGISSWEGLAADFVGGHDNVRPFERWAPDYRAQVWRVALAQFGASADAAWLAEQFRAERTRAYRLHEDALDVLDELRGDGVALAIVTNGPPDLQRDKVDRTGLADRVDAVVISGEVGVGKPDALMFERALDAIYVDPENAVMVGDSLVRDMQGAHDVGVRTIWRARRSQRSEAWKERIDALGELIPLLR